MKQVSLNGIYIYPFNNKQEFIDFIYDKKIILIAVNAEKIINKNNKLISIINHNCGYPDGIGAIWALSRKGYQAKKLPGVELWLEIINKFYKNKSFYLIGSSKEVIESTVQKLKTEFPQIEIKNSHNGFFNDTDKLYLLEDIKKLKPDIIFVAMGSPKQEFFMNELFHKYPALYMGLGGSFEIYSGNKKRAPLIFQRLYLEWFYRLLNEPTRIHRQIKLYKFVLMLLNNKF